MFQDEPYFMTNERWYRGKKGGGFELTSEATPEAIESYYEWLKENQKWDEYLDEQRKKDAKGLMNYSMGERR